MSGTLNNIAVRLGVAVSTVSRALAGKPGVSAARRQEIVALAHSLGIEPNAQAQALRSRTGKGLAIICRWGQADIVGLRNLALFRLAKEDFGHANATALGEGDDLACALRKALADNPRAIVLSHVEGVIPPELYEKLRRKNIPLVSIEDEHSGHDFVGVDRAVGMCQATRMLLLSGRCHLAYFSEACLDRPDARLRGILKAHQELGVELDPKDIIQLQGDYSYDSGAKLASELLRTRPVDGMFCYNDSMALGTLRTLSREGIKVPDEVMVLGFDDLPFAASLPVSLSTVSQPTSEVARAALDLALARLADPTAVPRRVIIPTRLVARESAPIRQNALREKIFASQGQALRPPTLSHSGGKDKFSIISTFNQ